ncbi:hypothetical protein HPP92_001219 [Vanilla planifolia]|uniref:ERCC4 domain-containing protein n=1 Tax=Vanilla planifolia TaxID=51239 RepID=A0A835SBJ5_VANPL|nr:hypothetical protein HPP92_001219 [Vanilla planifolia]
MDACLKELRKTNKVDVEDLTVENGLFKSFDEVVRRQLDPIWHTLGKKTKQLVSDLRTLRKLLDYLLRYDAVTYLKYLDTLRVSEGVRSVWIFAESSYKIFELAKKRVFQVLQADGVRISNGRKITVHQRSVTRDSVNVKEAENLKGVDNGVFLEEILEEAPKWNVLRELLEEIKERKEEVLSNQGNGLVGGANENNDLVLIACKDERSCLQLEECLLKGPHQVIRQEWENYLLGKVELHSLKKRGRKRSQDPKGYGILDGSVARSYENADPTNINNLENDALLVVASEINHIDKEEAATGDESQRLATVKGYTKGKSRGRSKKAAKQASASRYKLKKSAVKDKFDKTTLETAVQGAETNFHSERDLQGNNLIPSSTCNVDNSFIQLHSQDSSVSEFTETKPVAHIHFYALEKNEPRLDIWKPTVIIVFHPDITFVREIEVYKAENPSLKVKVYFLFYENSAEVQKFDASIRRENAAFESLIRQKSLMMIPVDQDGRCIGPTTLFEPNPAISLDLPTKKVGCKMTTEKEMRVIVDMREFMSSLPNVLHQKGMKVVPVTLDVGDYVLSPLVCVERKSISDLFQSFASGRLYHQVETMVRYYRIPVLLIEFSQDKSFSFQPSNDLGDDISPTSIISKLSLLVLHFPRLRLVWSRSVHATAEIFVSLKSNQDEPDEAKATRVGVPSEDGIIENDVRAANYNTAAIEFLRRLPGVTDSIYRSLMDGCKNLAELAVLPVERLAELMGGQKPAKMLREFLDAKFPTMI